MGTLSRDELRGLREEMTKAVARGMWVVRKYQLLGPFDLDVRIKPGDKTFVTQVDKESEKAIMSVLRQLQGIRFRTEEGGISGQGNRKMDIDPLDGTRSLIHGMTNSVVITALLNTRERLTICVIGEPITGRIWTAEKNGGCRLGMYDYRFKDVRYMGKTKVWQGKMSRQTTVLLDTSCGFTRSRDNKQILTDGQLRRFLSNMVGSSHFMITGSNGSNQALVANGGNKVVGCITTAPGGYWDVAGALLILEAGGSARAFTIVNGRKLQEEDPLKPTYDILIGGNNIKTVNTLTSMLRKALRG